MREPNQKFWDAMIIKAWQDFKNCGHLYHWSVAEFGKPPVELGLRRTKNMWSKEGVRVWVAKYMPMLSAKLFALPKERHIELLDWLSNSKQDSLTTKGSRNNRYYNEARSANKISERRAIQKTWSENLEKTLNRNNQWTVVK